MKGHSNGLLGALALAAKRQPAWHITAPSWLAELLVAAGAHRAPASDASSVSAFETFFSTTYPAIVKAVMCAGATLDDAEDAASAAMTEAYFAWPLLTNPAAWVRTAAIHHHINNAQRDRRRPLLEARATRREQGNPTNEHAEEPGERDRVLTALRELPPAQRKVMALVLDGHAPTEIAEMIGANPANVRSNLRHARERLQHSLAFQS